MGAYEESLRHIGEPDTPAERSTAEYILLEDYEALYLTEPLREWAHYYADGEAETVAVGMASYIDKQVRDLAEPHMRLYLHTERAREALRDAVQSTAKNARINESVEHKLAEVKGEQ